MNADGSAQVDVTTFDSAGHDQPAWSPDGSKIAFRHSTDLDSEIYVINADGSGTPQDLTHTRSSTRARRGRRTAAGSRSRASAPAARRSG